MTYQAIWNGAVLAESATTVVVEGNHYFPPDSLHEEYISPSAMKTLCFWKGIASYYHVTVDGVAMESAAWYYPKPSLLARKVKNHVAFSPSVQIIKTEGVAEHGARS